MPTDPLLPTARFAPALPPARFSRRVWIGAAVAALLALGVVVVGVGVSYVMKGGNSPKKTQAAGSGLARIVPDMLRV